MLRASLAAMLLMLPLRFAAGQGTVPTFQFAGPQGAYTLPGRDPSQGGTTTIPTVLVPVQLKFAASAAGGKAASLDAAPDVPHILASPIFANFAFPSGMTQYADAMLRATFPRAADWHTLLGMPTLMPITVSIGPGQGYLLTSKKTGASMAVVDIEYLETQLDKVAKQSGKLVLVVTRNTVFYTEGDATLCCSWGTHGVDTRTGNSYVLASYVDHAPGIVEARDVQPLTQQLAEFFKDPLHDPMRHGRNPAPPGNVFPAWTRPASMRPGDQGACGGTSAASAYFLLEPTDTSPKNNVPVSRPFVARVKDLDYHLQNAALLSWYLGPTPGLGAVYSFPDAKALAEPAHPCPPRGGRGAAAPSASAAAIPAGAPNGHKLIGYWSGYAGASAAAPPREISPQWDFILLAFATPDHNAPEGTMQFRTPNGFDATQFKSDIAWLKSQGRKVMISLGGGGQHFTLADPKRVPNFVASVTRIVAEYGFDGIDIDFESPSLSIDPDDADFQHPTTASIVNLISALRQLHDHFGAGFMISLVPEGTQIPAGYPGYGGQFGSYLPILHAIRDILSFVDVQDYNTPPLQGLDGEIYQAGTVDYHAAMTELLLHGFPVGGNSQRFFAPIPADKVAVGFLTGDARPEEATQAMDWIITGKAPAGARYTLRQPGGYPGMLGAMFWTLDADRRAGYNFSNTVGPQLHGYPPAR